MFRHSLVVLFSCTVCACESQPLLGRYGEQYGTGGVSGDGGGEGGGACRPGQAILTGAVVNARDLGGTPLAAGGTVACGQLYRGAPLYSFSADSCARFEALGIRTVIDLRTEDERLQKPDAACVGDVANVVSTPLPIPYNVSRADYITDMDAKASMLAALRLLADPTAYPVYFHCTWGRDRTGVLSAVVLLALGASPDAILREYMLSKPNVDAFPDSLVGVIEEIQRRGGIESYLTATGLSDDEIAALRAQAIAP